MIFGGRASFMPDVHRPDGRILHRGLLEVHPQLAGRRIEYAWGGNVGFTFDRMPHVGRTADGVAYAHGLLRDGRRPDDPPRARGWGSGWPAARRRRSHRLGFPLVPVPYEGRPWFLPIAGEWFRLQDRRAARTRVR